MQAQPHILQAVAGRVACVRAPETSALLHRAFAAQLVGMAGKLCDGKILFLHEGGERALVTAMQAGLPWLSAQSVAPYSAIPSQQSNLNSSESGFPRLGLLTL